MQFGKCRGSRRARFVLGCAAAAAAGACALTPSVSHAQNRWWVNGVASGNWNNPANWATFQGGAGGAGVPTNTDIARILHNNATNYNVTLDAGLTATVNALLIGNGGTGTNTLTQNSAGGITTAGFFGVGSAGGGGTTPTAVVNHSAGVNTIGGVFSVGLDVGSVGTYNLSGTGQVSIGPSGDMRIGALGSGTFNQTGGTVNAPARTVFVGHGSGSSGTYNLSGNGALGTTLLYVGYNSGAGTATGQFIQSGGAVGAEQMYIGGRSGASGFYSLSGVDSQLSGSLVQVGVNVDSAAGTANGTFTHNGGTHTVTGELSVGLSGGAGSNGTGRYNLSGGLLTTPNTLLGRQYFTGGTGTGSFVQTGGTHSTGNLRLGLDLGTTGAYTISGGSLVVANDMQIGDNGAGGSDDDGFGTFNHSGGTVSVGHYLDIGNDGPPGNASYTLSGPAQLDVTGQVIIDPNGVFTQTGGTHTISDGAIIGGMRVSGAYNLSGGTLQVEGLSNISDNGTFTHTGGTHTIGGDGARLILGLGATAGTYNLSGTGSATVNGLVELGFTEVSPDSPVGHGIINISGGNMTVTRSIALDGTFGTTTALNLSGGTLSVAAIEGAVARFHWTGGTLKITGEDGLTVGGVNGLQPIALAPAMNLVAGTVTVAGGSALSFNGGTADYATLRLAGGTVDGSAALTNASLIAGFGTIGGAGGFTNSGAVDVDAGTLTVANTGAIANAASGAITVARGARLHLSGGSVANAGLITLAPAGRITGTATINNNAGGVIAGSGTIATPLTNQPGGTLVVQLGTLTVPALGNAGTIHLAGPASTLAGGAITNTGVVRGDGVVNNTLANASSGEIRAENGKAITIANMPGPNAGRISLEGGAAHFNAALTNAATGQITGRGTLRANAGMTNNGQVNLIGGLSDVFGNITSTSGSKIIVSADATAIFYNPITLDAGSEFRVNDGSTAVFFGNVTGGAAAFTGSGTKQFENGASALGALATSGDTVVQTGASLTAGHVRETALTVDGLVTITPDAGPAGTSNVAELTIGAGGRVDLKDNKLVTVTPAGSFNGSAYTGVQGEVARAYNFGNWDMPGLTTSEELAGPNAGPLSGTTTIAVATAEQVMFIGPTDTALFMGQPVTGATTIAMYTYAGDLNLDGVVDGADYGTIDNFVQFPGTSGYVNGDINYDGVIDGADYGIIDNTVQLQGPPIPGVFSAAAAAAAPALTGVTAVPEPAASIFVLAAGFSCVSLRRRRRYAGSVFSPPPPRP